jgi:hypothetical protein
VQEGCAVGASSFGHHRFPTFTFPPLVQALSTELVAGVQLVPSGANACPVTLPAIRIIRPSNSPPIVPWTQQKPMLAKKGSSKATDEEECTLPLLSGCILTQFWSGCVCVCVCVRCPMNRFG